MATPPRLLCANELEKLRGAALGPDFERELTQLEWRALPAAGRRE
jgi:hypothetical protein